VGVLTRSHLQQKIVLLVLIVHIPHERKPYPDSLNAIIDNCALLKVKSLMRPKEYSYMYDLACYFITVLMWPCKENKVSICQIYGKSVGVLTRSHLQQKIVLLVLIVHFPHERKPYPDLYLL
jgi:hypothetical protein